jgi:hypothetical protein
VFVKEKSLNQKNNLNRGGGEYLKFHEFSSQIREPMIKSYAEKVIAHATMNGGICHQGFVKDRVDKAAQVAPLLKITRDNINNKVRNIKGPRKQSEVTSAIPYHAIGCPTLSTNLNSSVSSGLISKRASVENLLDILATQAAFILEFSNQCTVSMQLTLPN